jgi:hypothetical protein
LKPAAGASALADSNLVKIILFALQSAKSTAMVQSLPKYIAPGLFLVHQELGQL